MTTSREAQHAEKMAAKRAARAARVFNGVSPSRFYEGGRIHAKWRGIAEHRQSSCYLPYQGIRECARRRRQVEHQEKRGGTSS